MRTSLPNWTVLHDGQSRSSSINTSESDMIDELSDTSKKRKAILPSLSSRKRHKVSPNQGSPGVSKLKPKPAQLFLPDSPNFGRDLESITSPPPASIVDGYHRGRSIQQTGVSPHKSRINDDRRTVSSPAIQKASKSEFSRFYPVPEQNQSASDVIDISDDEEESSTTYNTVTTSRATYPEGNNKIREVIVIDDSDDDLGRPGPSRIPIQVASTETLSSKARPRSFARKTVPKPKTQPKPVRVDDDFDLSPIVVNRRTYRSSFPAPIHIIGNEKSNAVPQGDSSAHSVENSPEQPSLIIEPMVIEPVNAPNEDTNKELPSNPTHSAISDPSSFAKSTESTVFENELSPEARVDPELPVPDDHIPQLLQESTDVEMEPVRSQSPQQIFADPSSVRNPSSDDDPGFFLVPQLHVKSMLYGGDDGFFKDAFLAVRKDKFALIPSPKISSVDTELSVFQIKAQASGAVISPEPDNTSTDSLNIVSDPSLSDISLTDVIDNAYVNSIPGKSVDHKPPSGSPTTRDCITRTPDISDQVPLAGSKRGPPSGSEVIDLTVGSDSEDYDPSVVAAAIAFDAMLTKRTERTDNSAQNDGSHNVSPLSSLKQEIQSSEEILTPLQIIRSAATQKKHHHADASHLSAAQTSEIASIGPAMFQNHTPVVVTASECAPDEIHFPNTQTLTISAPEQAYNDREDKEDEADCLETLQYPPSSDDEDNIEENYLNKEPTISSSSTMSSNELATVDSDIEDDLHVHIRRNSSEPFHLVDNGVPTPLQNSWNNSLWVDFPPVRFTKDIPHLIQDRINQMDEFYRSSDMVRVVFESAIVQNTAEDEPNAPPIKVYNDVDDEATPPWEFHYSNHMWLGEGVPTPDYRNLKGCGCRGRCDPKSKSCLCIKRQEQYSGGITGFNYDDKGRLRYESEGNPILECNELCGCTDDCPNRIVQQGRRYPVNIVKTKLKGWGVFAGEKKIPAYTYVGIYAGEYLIDQVAEERGLKYNKFGRTYLFDVDCQYLKPSDVPDHEFSAKYVVDAYHVGNFTRFLNHSCEPNCIINPVVVNDDVEKPMLAIFTSADVEPYEELCFSYFGSEEQTSERKSVKDKDDAIYVNCCCGASTCTGKMFKP